MTPTNKLRWIVRYRQRNAHLVESTVLQQWWEEPFIEEDAAGVRGEWRDVPVEEETTK